MANETKNEVFSINIGNQTFDLGDQGLRKDFNEHKEDGDLHVTAEEKASWNAKAQQGEQGFQGAQGAQGVAGEDGQQGAQGESGTVPLELTPKSSPMLDEEIPLSFIGETTEDKSYLIPLSITDTGANTDNITYIGIHRNKNFFIETAGQIELLSYNTHNSRAVPFYMGSYQGDNFVLSLSPYFDKDQYSKTVFRRNMVEFRGQEVVADKFVLSSIPTDKRSNEILMADGSTTTISDISSRNITVEASPNATVTSEASKIGINITGATDSRDEYINFIRGVNTDISYPSSVSMGFKNGNLHFESLYGISFHFGGTYYWSGEHTGYNAQIYFDANPNATIISSGSDYEYNPAIYLRSYDIYMNSSITVPRGEGFVVSGKTSYDILMADGTTMSLSELEDELGISYTSAGPRELSSNVYGSGSIHELDTIIGETSIDISKHDLYLLHLQGSGTLKLYGANREIAYQTNIIASLDPDSYWIIAPYGLEHISYCDGIRSIENTTNEKTIVEISVISCAYYYYTRVAN